MTKESYTIIRRKRLQANGLCPVCGKVPPAYGYTFCLKCRKTNSKASQNTRWRKSLKRIDDLIEEKLLSVNEIAEILKVHRVAVHRLIKQGKLTVQKTAFQSFYIPENQVNRIIACYIWLECLKCGHTWHRRWGTGTNRCSNRKCRSSKVAVVQIGGLGLKK